METVSSVPKISVLVTAYNHEAYASQAIKSILSQRGEFDLEIIYCDDASTDNTPKIAREIQQKDSRLIPVLRSENVGMVGNFIDGLLKCTGDYIAYCDGDDFWLLEDKLQSQLTALRSHEDCSFSFHDVIISDSNGLLLNNWSSGRDSASWATGVKHANEFLAAKLIVFHATSVLFRREAIDIKFLQKLDRSLTGLDYAIAIMLGAQGSGYYFNEPWASYRKHHRSVSARQLSPRGIQSIFLQVASLERVANDHYEKAFANECEINRRGHIERGLNDLAMMLKQKPSLLAVIVLFQELLLNLMKKNISIRDAAYILKHKLLIGQ